MKLHWVMVEGRRAGNLCVFKNPRQLCGSRPGMENRKGKENGKENQIQRRCWVVRVRDGPKPSAKLSEAERHQLRLTETAKQREVLGLLVAFKISEFSCVSLCLCLLLCLYMW